METRKPIGYVVATVKFPVYEGEHLIKTLTKSGAPSIVPADYQSDQRNCEIIGEPRVELV